MLELRYIPDYASLQGRRDGEGFVNVAGEHTGRQTVVSGVGSCDHFLHAMETHDLLHWTENLK